MQVVINIEEEQLQEVMEQHLRALDSEYLGEVIAKAIEEYFRVNNYKNLEKLLFTEDSRYYGSRINLTEPFAKALSSADYSKLQDVVDAGIETLRNNYNDILIKVLSEMLANGIANTCSLKDKIAMEINEQLINRANPERY